MSRIPKLFALFFGIICLASPAHAEWYEASSERFVIYADDSEENIRIFAQNLERYHSALEDFTGQTLEAPSPSNRITVFVAGSDKKVARLAGSSGVAGFYLPRASGSVAFVQDVRNKEGRPDLSTIVLLHEYAHHFLTSINRFAMPLWMSEGAAEFLASAYFHEDGSVFLGLTASHRWSEIFAAEKNALTVRDLLAFDRPVDDIRTASRGFYGRSWLLYHYLSTNTERKGQLREYWLEVLKGTPSVEAGEKVFGSLSVLNRQLEVHWRKLGRRAFQVEASKIAVSEITVRSLSKGEAEMMDVRMQLERGVAPDKVANLVADAREIAAQYEFEPSVSALLAQAEYAAGQTDAAIAAADRGLSQDPNSIEALDIKGLALFKQARSVERGELQAAAYAEAMIPFRSLNAIEADHTRPLIYAYRSYVERGAAPPEDVKLGLVRAAELAPFDQDLWLIVGMMRMNDGHIRSAIEALQPLASNPHGNDKAEQVRGLLAFLATKEEGEAVPVLEAIGAYYREE